MQGENMELAIQSEISGFFNLCQCTALAPREKVWEECNKFHEKKYILTRLSYQIRKNQAYNEGIPA